MNELDITALPQTTTANKQLKILVIPPSYFDVNRTVGGGERYAWEYAKALSELAPTTLGLFSSDANFRDEDEIIKRYSVRHLKHSYLFPATRQTLRTLRQFDVIHAMIFPSPLTDLILLLSLTSKTKVVLTDIGGGIPCLSSRIARFGRRLNLNRRAAGLAHLSQYAATAFRDWQNPRTILYGGIRETIADESTPQLGGYALFVGRLLPHKGVLELISALSPDIPLRVVGRPYDQAYFEKLKDAATDKQVAFFTSADDRELSEHYRSANVVIQPSLPSVSGNFDRAELLGLVALEGMSWGKPVVVTNTASLPELMVDGKTGVVVPVRDGMALNSAVSRFVKSPELSRTVGEQARAHAMAHYTWSAAARRGLDFYSTL